MSYSFEFVFGITIFFCITSILSRTPKIKRITGIIALVGIFLIMSSVIVGKDSVFGDLYGLQNNYLSHAVRNRSALYQGGFNRIIVLFNRLGYSFGQFKAFIVAFILFSYWFLMKKYTVNIGYFALFYIVHMSIFDSCMLRNTVAFGLIVIGIGFLLSNSNKKIVKYIVVVILASTIHSASIFYIVLIVPFISKVHIKKIEYLYFTVILILIVLFYTSSSFLSFLWDVGGVFFNTQRYAKYAVQGTHLGNMPVIFCWVLTIWNAKNICSAFENEYIVSTSYFQKVINNKLMLSYKETDIRGTIIYLKNILYASCLMIPLTVLSLHFARLIRNMTIIYLIMSCIIIGSANNKKIQLQTVAVNIITVSIWIWFDMSLYGAFDLNSLSQYMFNGEWFWLQ